MTDDRRHPPLLRLADGEHLHVDGAWVSVVRGRVWVTQVGDPHDRFLESGQGIWVAPDAQGLVGAEGPAQVTLAQAPTVGSGMQDALAALVRWWRRDASPRGPAPGRPQWRPRALLRKSWT